MTQAVPRTHFLSSRLIRCLADLGVRDAVEQGSAFAEQLGAWVHFADAIPLSAVLSNGVASPANMPSQAPIKAEARPQADARNAACAKTREDVERIETFLATSIARSCSPNPGRVHLRMPDPVLELPLDLAATGGAYRRFYEAHQRDMELSIQPLRTNTRHALAKASPRLRKLAELDATFEKILRERESKLLSKVPVLLRKRYEYLFKAHQQTLADTQQDDNPSLWMREGGWLHRFCTDMHMLLLAELELRLQPTIGLIEAFEHDTQ